MSALLNALRKIADYGRSAAMRHVVTLGLGTVIGQGLVVLASPIWSRLYTPEDLGRLGLFVSFLNVAAVAVSLRYDMAIPLGRDRRESVFLLMTAIVICAPVSILAAILFLYFSEYAVLGFGGVPPSSWILMLVLLILTGVFSALRFWHVKYSQFAEIARALVAQGAGRALIPILAAPLKLGWLGLLAGELVGRALSVRLLGRGTLAQVRAETRGATLVSVRTVLTRFRKFPTVFAPSSVLDAAGSSAVLPVFILLNGLQAGGEFLLAQQVVMVPSALLCASLADVYHWRIVDGAREDPAAITGLLLRGALRLGLLAIAIYLPVALLAPTLTGIIFGPDWRASGSLAALLAPVAVIGIIVSPLSRALVISRLPELKFLADFAKLALPVAGLYIGHWVSPTPGASTAAYAIMSVIAYAFYFAVILYAVQPGRQRAVLDQ